MGNSKKKSLEKIRLKNRYLSDLHKKQNEDFMKSIGKNIGEFVTCKKSLKAPGLLGGFTKGISYKILGFCGEHVCLLDDENKEYDTMDLSLNYYKEYFY
jgi:hypothetical protein